MKLTQRGNYALRALVVLGRQSGRQVVPIRTIARSQNIPQRFLEQILNDLKSAGVVESRRGIAGGYRLSRPPASLSLAFVVRHLDGMLAPVSCVSSRFYEKCSCPDESRCAVRSIMQDVYSAMVKVMEPLTVADLCERAAQLEGDPLSPLDFVI